MKLSIWPKTRLGKWSVWLIIALILLVLIFFALVKVFNQRGGEGFFDNLLLAVPGLLAFGCGAMAFVTGVISFFKRERAVLVVVSSLIGLLVLLYGVAEIVFPH